MFELSDNADAAVRPCILIFKLIIGVTILYLLGSAASRSRALRSKRADFSRLLRPKLKVEPPKKKLFLSWAAVQRAVRNGSVTEEELDDLPFLYVCCRVEPR